ncbi:hypothetical protein SDC9_59417 [bioreactor metagenome]|uniref:Uncharacterized protein n=1 Tax=bioreactor metagenome TaxID=1076179 RepID=A0A644XA51_9ZZZZ
MLLCLETASLLVLVSGQVDSLSENLDGSCFTRSIIFHKDSDNLRSVEKSLFPHLVSKS